MKNWYNVLALTAFLATAPQAQAGILAYAVYVPDFTFDEATPQPNFIPLKGTTAAVRSNFVKFNVPRSGQVKITFTSECFLHNVTDDLTWVEIDIVIDNDRANPVPPTKGKGDAFCGNNTNGGKIFTRGSITVVKSLKAGDHTVRINGRVWSEGVSPDGNAALSQNTILVEQ